MAGRLEPTLAEYQALEAGELVLGDLSRDRYVGRHISQSIIHSFTQRPSRRFSRTKGSIGHESLGLGTGSDIG